MPQDNQPLLPPGPGDEAVNSELLSHFELFRSLKRKIRPEAVPGSMRLRKIRGGEVVVRQGDAGFSAFYIVPWSDILELRRSQLQDKAGSHPPSQLAAWREEVQMLEAAAPDSSQAPFRAVFANSRLPAKPRRSWWKTWWGGERTTSKPSRAALIRNDGLADIDLEVGSVDMFAGEIFGEMTCMTRQPRAATVVASRDAYVLEFVSWVFSTMQRDAAYRQRVEDAYKQRVLTSHLRKSSTFEGVPAAALERVGRNARLEVFEPGAVICEEEGESNSLFLIRLGLVQVVKGVASRIKPADAADWPRLCRELLQEKDQAESQRIPPAVDAARTGKPSAAELLAAAKNKNQDQKPAGKPSAADLLAQARAAKKPTQDAAKPAGKPSAADLLAQARAAKKPTEDAAKPAGKPSAADLLAQARAAKTPTEDAAKPAGKPSAADLLAQARARSPQAGGAAGGKTPLVVEQHLGSSEASPHVHLWNCLSAEVQRAVRALAEGRGGAKDIQLVADAFTELMRHRKFVGATCYEEPVRRGPGWRRIETFNESTANERLLEGARSLWTEAEVREAGRIVLESLFPDLLSSRGRTASPPRILSYLNRGDCFGEMGVLLNQPRTATCVAYDHPPNERAKRPGRVEVIRIPAEDVRELLDQDARLKQRLDSLASARQQQIDDVHAESAELIGNREYRDLGLFQGQNLLLIDLDKCTRCGDCVQACIGTHDDGRSRLHLDGPRFERFLVPSACRQCLDPACLRECPVTAIYMGDNHQIEIADHCIGCRQCYSNCPYGSIQMHDIGVIPTRDAGWRAAVASPASPSPPATAVEIETPWQWTLETQHQLRQLTGAEVSATPPGLSLWRALLRRDAPAGPHTLTIETPARQARLFLDGQELPLQHDARKGVWTLVWEPAEQLRRTSWLRVDVSDFPPPQFGDWLFALRLDAHPESAGESSEMAELITEQAVVCDLCSSLPSQIPACVHQCPHDAAIRIVSSAGQRIPL